jgi:hypothetical protein
MFSICPKTFVKSRDAKPCLHLCVDECPELKKITVNSDNAVKFKFLECVCANSKKCKTYSGRNKKIYADIYYNEQLNNADIKIEHYFILFFGRNMSTEDIIGHLDSSIKKMSIMNKNVNKKIRLTIVVSTFSSGIERVNIQGGYHKALEKYFGNIIDVKICPFRLELRKYLELLGSNPLDLI